MLSTKNTFVIRVDILNEIRIAEPGARFGFFENVLNGLSCTNCSESDLATLDFHHTDPSVKEGSVMQMLNEFRSKDAILKEVAKCVVLCSNCHRKFHVGNIKLRIREAAISPAS